MTLERLQPPWDTGVTVKEKQKNTIQKYGDPACKIVKGWSGALGVACNIALYGLDFLHDTFLQY